MAAQTNVTFKVDQQVLLHARWRALREGTSVNAVVEQFLVEYAGQEPAGEPKRRRAPRIAPRSPRATRPTGGRG